jgi:HK97 gp10 family phage protein
MTDSFSFESDILDTLKALNDLPKEVNQEVNKVTRKTVFKAKSTAVKSISASPSMGAVYGNHTASKAGDAPNTDTGNLVQSIKVRKQKTLGGLDSYLIGSALDYAAWLEFGTLTTAARPWLQPAVDKVADDHVKRMTKAVKKAINDAEL